MAELLVDAAEVVEKTAQVADVGAVVAVGKETQRLAAAFDGAAEAFAVNVVFACAQGLGGVAAGLSLHFE
ncbi:hypothetical protein NM3147_2231 [Neisseria meningitidis NM3147]|nr:hypothetical protein NM3147_2231 [Neisseria meningitidis NM3147]